ncbi:MAG: hypothetical protein J5663_07410 [Bacteroidaceae bacterium]|nr:hypothetical protein [Bacteroidaceae bacterium]
MKNKAYIKPTLRVAQQQLRMQLLCGSGIKSYDDDFAYMPNVKKADNELA